MLFFTKLDESSIDLGNGLISEEEYNKKLIDIYNLNNSNDVSSTWMWMGAFSSFCGIILWRIFSFREGGSQSLL